MRKRNKKNLDKYIYTVLNPRHKGIRARQANYARTKKRRKSIIGQKIKGPPECRTRVILSPELINESSGHRPSGRGPRVEGKDRKKN